MDNEILETLKNKSVLVTGAGGSIATELCEMLLQYPIRELRMLNVSETAIYNLKRKLQKYATPMKKLVFVLGNVTDERLLQEHVPWCDIVIHAAAHKHVPLCEENVLQAVLNNVGGTKALLDMSARHGVRKFIFVSTDKAVHPSSIMGMTKRIGELMTIHNTSSMTASVVRFGNVMGTAGSVLPLWEEQIAAGRAITITDPECTRFMMNITEACDLILSAMSFDVRGLYVFDMGMPVNMQYLAEELMRKKNKVVPIEITGLRPGEKIHEELTYGEDLMKTPHPRIMRVHESGESAFRLARLMELLNSANARQQARVVQIMREMTQ